MSVIRTGGQRLLVVLLVLAACSGPLAGQAMAGVDRTPVSIGEETAAWELPAALPGRAAPSGVGAVPDDTEPHDEHRGPLLDALLLDPPEPGATGPAARAVEHGADGGPGCGDGCPKESRGPPKG